MADETQLTILKEGVEAWNRWRSQNREVEVDLIKADLYRADLYLVNLRDANLREANLRESDLRGADFSKANLTKTYLYEASLSKVHLYEAKLHRANLRGADLREADLRRSDLRKANLSKANLYRANLRGAELRGVDLCGANLRGADLRGTDLRGADLGGVSMEKTSLGDIDLSAVQGLGTVKHFGPSTVGIDTIYLSKGKIPEVFLRGAGVPDAFIAYLKSLVTNPIEYYSCFISYSSEDEEFAQRLYKDLQGKGVRCWFVPHDVQGGRKLHEQIDQAIRVP
jgi:Pentapeptide repeats (8 copies)/TIR domain